MKHLRHFLALLLITFSIFPGAMGYLLAESSNQVTGVAPAENETSDFQMIKLLIQNNQLSSARQKIESELKKKDHPQLHLLLARVFAAKGQKQKGLNYLTNLIETKGRVVFTRIRGQFLAEMGYLQSAKEDFLYVNEQQGGTSPALLKQLAALSRAEGNFRKALRYIKKAVKQQSQDAALWYEKARIELGLTLIDEARLSSLKAIELDPKVFDHHKMYVDILGFYKSGKGLEGHLRKMAVIFPNNPWVALRLSALLLGKNNYHEAREVLKSSLKVHPKNADLLFQIGTVLAATENLKHAAVVYHAGLGVQPNSTWAKIQLAKIYLKLKNLKSAIQLLEAAFKDKTKDMMVYETLAKYYNQTNDTAASEKVIIAGLKIRPDSPYLLLEYADFLLKNHDRTGAIRALEEALSLQKSNYMIYAKLGNLYRLNREYEKAENYLETAIEINGKASWIRAFYVELLVQQKRWEDALDILDDMIELGKKDYWPHTKKAIIEIQIEEYEDALRSVENAIRYGGKKFLLELIKAEILEYLEKYKEAEYVYLNALKKQPHNGTVLTKLAFIQVHLDLQRAQKTVHQAIQIDRLDLSILALTRYLEGKKGDDLGGKDKKRIEEVYQHLIEKNLASAEDGLDDLKSDGDPAWVYLNYLCETIFEKSPITPIDLSKFTISSLTPVQLMYLGEYAIEFEQYEIAKEIFETLLEKSPGSLWGIGKLALCYENLKMNSEAVRFFETYLEKRGESLWALSRVALLYDLLKRPEASENAYLKILEKNPNDNVALNNLAWLYLNTEDPKLRKVNEALELSIKAIKLSATSANLDTLAEAYYQKGEYKRALRAIQGALNKEKEKSDYFKKQKKKILKAIKLEAMKKKESF